MDKGDAVEDCDDGGVGNDVGRISCKLLPVLPTTCNSCISSLSKSPAFVVSSSLFFSSPLLSSLLAKSSTTVVPHFLAFALDYCFSVVDSSVEPVPQANTSTSSWDPTYTNPSIKKNDNRSVMTKQCSKKTMHPIILNLKT